MSALPVPSEHHEQASLFREMALLSRTDPRWSAPFAIPNGGKRSIGVAVKMKAEGVKAGVPDIFVPVPCGGFFGLFVEMKRKRGGSVSEEQRAFIASLDPRYKVEICKGAEEAIDKIRQYFAGGPT